MKTINSKLVWVVLIAIFIMVPTTSKAQMVNRTYFNIDWQFNIPTGNKFADVGSGWGMNFDGGYYVTPSLGVGGFISYHTNNKYIPRETLHLSSTSALTTDQQHSIFQLPFGAQIRYRFNSQSQFQPYIGARLGANYSKMSSYYYIVKDYKNSWGFYASPEIGINIFPTAQKQVGFHVALYYSYATNQSDILTYSVDGLNNLGFRLGITF